MTKPAVLWFRRDLRLDDHPALAAAAAQGRQVVPLFVIDPRFRRAGAPRQAFLARALGALDARLGGLLVIREGDPRDVVPSLADEVGATSVHVTRDHGPYGRQRDAATADALQRIGVSFVGTGSNYAVEPGTVEKADGTAYRVFTPFSRGWRSKGWELPLDRTTFDVATVPWLGRPQVASAPLPHGPMIDTLLPAADEASQHARWDSFLPRVADYSDQRNLPAVDGTSRLSAALRWGLVHPRQLLVDLPDGKGATTFANELAWREFYADVLLRNPTSAWSNLDARMDAMPVDGGAQARRRFARWEVGQTGFPIIDAAMRQLAATGWMHNRTRMLVASFLVKDLHLPWQWGAAHFMRHLVDGDLASNSHGWQWTAGTGTDAAPYFRVFNPTTQAERFDPEGDYVREWVPELRGIPGGAVHSPGLQRPSSYPEPMVDHAVEREEALRRYQSLRK